MKYLSTSSKAGGTVHSSIKSLDETSLYRTMQMQRGTIVKTSSWNSLAKTLSHATPLATNHATEEEKSIHDYVYIINKQQVTKWETKSKQ